ncbi:unnamed protein product [Orchesella dallaii]|uniref:Aminopeptidase n=1 Tax=Orchesella dallaii TaxID=48710 RepID=A0ABP1PS71_9HEXA
MEGITRKHWNLLISFTSVTVIVLLLAVCICTGALAPASTSSAGDSSDISFRTSHNDTRASARRLVARASVDDDEKTVPKHRLPKSVIPRKYSLTIVPILDAGFEDVLGRQWEAPGHVVVDVVAAKVTKTIILHAKNITIHNVTITHNSEEISVRNISLHERFSFMKIHLNQHLTPGDPYTINITFTSYVSEVLNGLFRSSYINQETEEQEWFAATHMEALHARQMFPCFDEPNLKAAIEAKVGRREDYVALFNTESTGNETMQDVDGWVWETFAPTVPMSTYLTALIVAKFQYSEAPGKLLPETRVRTYAPPHYIKQGAAVYPTQAAERILSTYGDYFKEKYPMKKFDCVAVPAFLYGAMENYGLSIFRETLLLHFNHSTESQRYIVTNVIAHELGHQWFGNLVSPEWWTNLWLSEGLTKFLEYIGLNATIPEFQPWDIFISESLQLGLRLDSDSRTSHSLKIDEDAWLMKNEMEWFDDIAYKKGGSLIRMVQGFLSEPVMRKGLSRYLSRMKYKAAVQDDLFADCDKEGQLAHKLPDNTTMKEVMSGWTLQAGFPLLKVSLQGASNVTVTQEKYLTSGGAGNEKKVKWFIPVSVATTRFPNFDPEPEFWMRDNETTVSIRLPANSWIILNAGNTGFYRVLYDDELTNRITNQLMEFPERIHKYSRAQLMDDYFNSAWNRYISVKTALNLTRYMKDHAETEQVVWTSLLAMLKTAFRLFKESEEEFTPLQKYMLPRIEKAIQATGGYDAVNINSTGMPVLRHAQLLDWACNLNSRGCIQHALELVKSWKNTGQLTIPRDFRTVIFSTAVASDSSGEMFEFFKEQYKNGESVGGLKDQILTALSNTQDPGRIKR